MAEEEDGGGSGAGSAHQQQHQQRLGPARSYPCLSALAAAAAAATSGGQHQQDESPLPQQCATMATATSGATAASASIDQPAADDSSSSGFHALSPEDSSLSFFLMEADLAAGSGASGSLIHPPSSSRLSDSRSPSPSRANVADGEKEADCNLNRTVPAGGEASSSTSLGLLLDQISVEGAESGSAGSIRSSSYDMPMSRSGHDSINSKVN